MRAYGPLAGFPTMYQLVAVLSGASPHEVPAPKTVQELVDASIGQLIKLAEGGIIDPDMVMKFGHLLGK